jgi:hypothetical protein
VDALSTKMAALALILQAFLGTACLDEDPARDPSRVSVGTTQDDVEDPVGKDRTLATWEQGGDPEDPSAPAGCRSEAPCFSWCGVATVDSACFPAEEEDPLAEDLAPPVCDPLILEVSDGGASGKTVSGNPRCLLRAVRHGSVGVAEAYWSDAERGFEGHLAVEILGSQFVRLEVRLDGPEPACGQAITLSAARAHVRDERDALFDACIDDPDGLDPIRCVLGPAAAFYADHEWTRDLAFPWLSGACGPS